MATCSLLTAAVALLAPQVILEGPRGITPPRGVNKIVELTVSLDSMSLVDRMMAALPWAPDVCALLLYAWVFLRVTRLDSLQEQRVTTTAKIVIGVIFGYLALTAATIAGYRAYFSHRLGVDPSLPYSIVSLIVSLLFVVVLASTIIALASLGSNQLTRADDLDEQLKGVV
jgi:hypothetical protein